MKALRKSKNLSRRDFLRLGAVAGAGTLAACAAPPASTPVVVTREIEKLITATPGPTVAPVATATPAPSVAKKGGILVHAMTTDIPSLDPHTVALRASRQITALFYSQLLTVDTKLRVQPGRAQSWEYPDNTTILFHLRQGVKWHDGTEFTSADVVYTFQRLKDVESEWASGFTGVKSMTAPDKYTVKFVLEQPQAALLSALYTVHIVPASIASKPKDWLAKNVLGTGPWMVKDWQPDSKYTLIKNPNYWKPGLPYLDGVDLQIIPDETSIIAALRTGKVHLYRIQDSSNVPTLRTNPNLVVYQSPSLGTNFVNLQHRTEVIKDVRVRRALSLGMDRQAILDAAGGGLGVVSGAIPPALADYYVPPSDLKYIKYDPDQAKKLIKEYGKPVPVKIITLSGGVYTLMEVTAELLADQWRKIGCDTEVVVQEVGVWLASRLTNFDYTVSTNLSFDGADPDAILYNEFSTKGNYQQSEGFNDPQLDALLEQGRTEMDQAKRVDIYKQAQELIDDQVYELTTFAPIRVVAAQSSVKNFYAHPAENEYALEQTWLES